MNILIADNGFIPVTKYGGTERVIWSLGKELTNLGHNVTYLVAPGSYCEFANVIHRNPEVNINLQIPENIDFVHFNYEPNEDINKPYLVTIHGNRNDNHEFNINTVFVSKNHAARYGSSSFVYNGLYWDDYPSPDLIMKRSYFHFLGSAAWRVKNVRGAIKVVLKTKNEKLYVLGGSRLNFNMGFRFTLQPRIRFFGMVGGTKKSKLINGSKGLIFPVRWHEPFGLAIIESLYYGCPVFGTPYGSLPEIVKSEVGYLSPSSHELANAIGNAGTYDRRICHEYALENFNSVKMAIAYLEKYEMILNGKELNNYKPCLIEVQKDKFLAWD